MYRYETHLHTYPVSKCAKASVRESLEAYKKLGYDGVFVTNHFLDGNVNIDKTLPYEVQIEFYFSDYEEAKRLEEEIGVKVFPGVEISYKGTDFLIYGLDKKWYLEHPEIMQKDISEKLKYYMEAGALVIHAHPYREASYIDHIRLFPGCVHGVEIYNACRTEHENRMAEIYAKEYGFLITGGSDNHIAGRLKTFGGMQTETPLDSVEDFISRIKAGSMEIFRLENTFNL